MVREDREKLEEALAEELVRARARYEKASIEFRASMERKEHREALQDFARALRRFNDLVIRGIAPD